MASSSSQPTRDWNAEWASKDVSQLTQIPTNRYGLCGCRICGGPRLVNGRTFRTHMFELHGSKPSPVKRLRQLTPETAPTIPNISLAPALDDALQFDDDMDVDFDHGAVGDDEDMAEEPISADGKEAEAGEEEEEGQVGVEPLAEGGASHEEDGQGSFSMSEMAALMEYANDAEFELPALEPVSRQPSPQEPSPTRTATRSIGPFISAPAPSSDLLERWPYPIPISMREPEYSGARLNPHLVPTEDQHDLSVLQRLVPILAFILSGVFNVARRPVELVLQATSAIIRYAEKVQYNRFRQWYTENHPNADSAMLESLDLLDPSFNPPAAPASSATALRRIQVETSMIVHPQCRNAECHHVFYDIDTQASFSNLPLLCPDCQTPMRNAKGDIHVLHFPRRTLKSELEVVFRVPGVEDAIERRGDRKRQRDDEDEEGGVKSYGKVYRQQDDGTAWRADRDGQGEHGRRGLSITVNLGLDWANMSSRRSAANDSFGPITLLIADLPAQLRSSFSCAMLLGITPGPKAPKAKNLHKLLVPLIMELRDAELNGIWVRTPAYPQGRLIHVNLGCICCDRPAACEITGGPFYLAKTTPCLRCEIHSSQIPDLASYPYPARDSDAHARGQLDQLVSIPLAIEEDRARHAQEQAEALRTGGKKSRYTKKRELAVIKAATIFPGHLSALTLLPGFDKFGMCIFDPMHSLLEGAVRTYMHKVLVLGSHGSEADDQRLNDLADDRGEEEGDDRGDAASVGSAAETEYASETDALQAQTIAVRFVEQIEQGQLVVSTPAERRTLRQGIARLSAAPKKARRKKMTPKDMEGLHGIIDSIQTPVSVPRLHPQFGTPTAGTPTANHWRVFSTVYGPLAIPLLFHQRGQVQGRRKGGNAHLSASELKALMLLFEIVTIALRSTISEKQIVLLESLIVAFQSLAFTLHPTLSSATNLHVISHLGDDIRRFGPTYGWWTFLIERINYVIKHVNQSGGSHYQASVVALRAASKAREVVSARMRVLATTDDDTEADKAITEELAGLFDSVSHEGVSDVLQQVSLRYADIEREKVLNIGTYSTSRLPIKPRGRVMDRTLDDLLLRRLQDCFASWGTSTRTLLDPSPDHSLPYLPARATFWEGMLYGGRRLDAAQWDSTLQLKVGSFEATELVSRRNSLLESRRQDWVYGCDDKRAVAGVLCAIFEHSLQLPDGTLKPPRLYGVLRKFKPYRGEDFYGYRKHPALGIWLWEVDDLEDAIVIWLTGTTTDSLRPLAIARLPQQIDEDGQSSTGDVWATVPLHHHHVYIG